MLKIKVCALLDNIEDVKEKITDNEYKTMVDTLKYIYDNISKNTPKESNLVSNRYSEEESRSRLYVRRGPSLREENDLLFSSPVLSYNDNDDNDMYAIYPYRT